jgi:imidazolonepropionase-like amidohydrolase
LVKGRDEIVEQIRLQAKEGVDCIKVSGSSDLAIANAPVGGAAFTAEEFNLIATESHRLERKCTVHARSGEATRLAAAAGFDWIMHASFIDEEGIELCLKNNIAIVPTLTLLANILASAQGEAGASIIDEFRHEYESACVNLRKAYDAGVPLICGSESGWSLVPYGDWHARELEIFVNDIGLTPIQAIHAATGAAARLLPRWTDRIGTLAEGKLADILVVDGDPSTDVTLLQRPQNIVSVMKGGSLVDIETPIPDRRIWSFEKHRTFLPGWFKYDSETGRGYLKTR